MKTKLTWEELLHHPQMQALFGEAESAQIEAHLATPDCGTKDPILIQILTAGGAWFTALFLLPFLGLLNVLKGAPQAIVSGALLMVAAILINRRRGNNFSHHFSLAIAMAGNLLMVLGVFLYFDPADPVSAPPLIAQLVICGLVYRPFENNIYRFLAPMAVTALLITLFFELKTPNLIHLLIALELVLAGYLLFKTDGAKTLKPLTWSMIAMLPFTILVTNLLHTNRWSAEFTPHQWPSNVILSVGLIYLMYRLAESRRGKPWFILAVAASLLLGAFTSSGILVSLLLLLAGMARDDRALTVMGYLFLPCFLFLYYYTLHVDLAYKSWVISGSGALLLGIRFLLGHPPFQEKRP